MVQCNGEFTDVLDDGQMDELLDALEARCRVVTLELSPRRYACMAPD